MSFTGFTAETPRFGWKTESSDPSLSCHMLFTARVFLVILKSVVLFLSTAETLTMKAKNNNEIHSLLLRWDVFMSWILIFLWTLRPPAVPWFPLNPFLCSQNNPKSLEWSTSSLFFVLGSAGFILNVPDFRDFWDKSLKIWTLCRSKVPSDPCD